MRTVKYTGFSDEMGVYCNHTKTIISFKRNVWKQVSDEFAEQLFKSQNWLDKEDFILDISKLTTPTHIGIMRFGALGDLIQLIPVVRYLKRKYGHTFVLFTQRPYVEYMQNFSDTFDKVSCGSDLRRSKNTRLINLDGVLESDHSVTNEERNLHRITIFERFFNIKCDVYDFSLLINDETKSKIEGLLK